MGKLYQYMMNNNRGLVMEDKSLTSGCFRKKVLTVAGSDCSGGAGIQADLKTMSAHAVYGMSVITAITVQNTTGVMKSEPVPASIVAGQIDAVCSDIMPDAVKTGMLFSEEIINVVSHKIKEYSIKNVVIDPVFVSTSGSQLLEPQAAEALKEKLLPLAMVITPNIPEAQALTGININNKDDMLLAALKLSKASGANVLVKGGHNTESANDLLYCTEETARLHLFNIKQNYNIADIKIQADGNSVWFMGERINTSNTHGTGCTLSSAIACNLAYGMDIITAIAAAKSYLTRALNAGLEIGHGDGPVDHCWNINAPKHM